VNKSELVANFLHLLKAIKHMIFGQNANHIIEGVKLGYPTIKFLDPLRPLIFNVFDEASRVQLNNIIIDPVDPTNRHVFYAMVKFNITATGTNNPFTLLDPLGNKVYEYLDTLFAIDQNTYTFPVLISSISAIPPGVVFSAFFSGYLIKVG